MAFSLIDKYRAEKITFTPRCEKCKRFMRRYWVFTANIDSLCPSCKNKAFDHYGHVMKVQKQIAELFKRVNPKD